MVRSKSSAQRLWRKSSSKNSQPQPEGSDLLKTFQDSQTASGFPMLRYFCSECGWNLFMRPGDKVSTEMGLKIVSYGCLDLEEGDGRCQWRKFNSFLGSR